MPVVGCIGTYDTGDGAARAALSSSGVVTGARQVKSRQTYAAGAPSTGPRPNQLPDRPVVL